MTSDRPDEIATAGAPPASLRYYRAYGLTIAADLPLAELQPAPAATPDVSFTRADIDRPLPSRPGDRISEFGENEIYFGWAGIARFLMTGRSVIQYMPDAGFDPMLLSVALLGPLLGLVLEGRGLLLLHGSGLVVDGRAALFLGDKGAGKSTIAAAFMAQGYRMLADDILAIDCSGPRPFILAGYPAIKLSPEAAETLAPPVHGEIATDATLLDKRRLRVDDRYSDVGVEVGAIYLLERGDTLRSSPRGPQDGLMALMRFSYATRFGDQIIRGAAAARHLRQCAALANGVPTRVLQVPSALSALPDAVRHVAAELAATPAEDAA